MANTTNLQRANNYPNFYSYYYSLAGDIELNPGPPISALSHTPENSTFKFHKGLSVAHINIRSLLPKLDELRAWCLMNKPKAIILTETWLTPKTPDANITIQGYFIFRRDRSKRGGGVLFYIADTLQFTLLTCPPSPPSFEILVGKICLTLF
ncbi:hypothetical protein FKM82_024679 [Ascaphus truei]